MIWFDGDELGDWLMCVDYFYDFIIEIDYNICFCIRWCGSVVFLYLVWFGFVLIVGCVGMI